MKNKIMTFSEFKILVTEIYKAFSQHCSWSELRVWNGVPGDLLQERDCWYAIMRVNPTCCMVVMFSPDDDDDKPFTCWYDYTSPKSGMVNYPHWNFATLEEAMQFCTKEPMKEYQNDMYSICVQRKVASKANGITGHQTLVSMSFVSAFDYLMSHTTDDKLPEGDWDVCQWRQPLGRNAVEPLYRLHSGRFPDCDWFFLTSPAWGFPEYIYQPLNKTR